jgi:Putative Ig domain/Bacterial Ig domain
MIRTPRTGGILATLLLVAAAMPASAQIVGAGAGGYIQFRSGLSPYNVFPAFVDTGIQRIPINGPYLFLQRWHGTAEGFTNGGTAIRALAAPFSYWFQVPTNTYLFQRRNAPCNAFSPPAKLFIHFDAVFDIGAGGFPAHTAFLGYPVVGQNGPGPGSYSYFYARLMFGMRPGPNAAITNFGHADIEYFNPIPGMPFAAFRSSQFRVPRNIPPGWQFLVWGDITFETRGCPRFFAADGLQIKAGPGEDGQIGVEDDSPTPPFDPSIPDVPIADPENVFMDMPLPPTPQGEGVIVNETSTDALGNVNHRPQMDPIPEMLGMEQQPVFFTANAVDMDGDPLTWSLEGAPAGMAIDSFGNVTWTPGPGESGVYRFKVKVSDGRGDLEQIDEEQVTLTIEGLNHAPSFHAPDFFVDEGNTFTASLYAYDPDGDNLTYELRSPAPTGLTLSSNGLLTWAPTEGQGPRDYTLRVRVTDDGAPNLWQERAFTIHVNEFNFPPQVQPVPAVTVNPGQTVTFQVTATDPDTRPGPEGPLPMGPLTYSLQNAPAGATIDSETGAFTWTPDSTQLGTWNFAVMVTDVQGGTGYTPIQITVNGYGYPKPPYPTPKSPKGRKR